MNDEQYKRQVIFRGTSGALPDPNDPNKDVRFWPRCSSTGRDVQSIARDIPLHNPRPQPRTEIGRALKDALQDKIYPKAGRAFIECDYTAAEMRIVAQAWPEDTVEINADIEAKLASMFEKIFAHEKRDKK